MKRLFVLFLIAAAGAFIISACGKNEDLQPIELEPETETQTVAAPERIDLDSIMETAVETEPETEAETEPETTAPETKAEVKKETKKETKAAKKEEKKKETKAEEESTSSTPEEAVEVVPLTGDEEDYSAGPGGSIENPEGSDTTGGPGGSDSAPGSEGGPVPGDFTPQEGAIVVPPPSF